MTSACLLGTAVKRWAWSSVWGSLQKGSIFISNTESRVSEPHAELDKVLEEQYLRSKTAQRFRGRMQFADSPIFGKTGKRCMRILAGFREGRRVRLQPKDCFS